MQAIFRKTKLLVTSAISTNFMNSNFRNSELMDVAFIRCDFMGVDFLGTQYHSITAEEVDYDGSFAEIFNMSRDTYSPATREWGELDGFDEDEVQDYLDEIDDIGEEDDDDDEDDEEEDNY